MPPAGFLKLLPEPAAPTPSRASPRARPMRCRSGQAMTAVATANGRGRARAHRGMCHHPHRHLRPQKWRRIITPGVVVADSSRRRRLGRPLPPGFGPPWTCSSPSCPTARWSGYEGSCPGPSGGCFMTPRGGSPLLHPAGREPGLGLAHHRGHQCDWPAAVPWLCPAARLELHRRHTGTAIPGRTAEGVARRPAFPAVDCQQ